MSKHQSEAPTIERSGLHLAAPPRGESSAAVSIYRVSGSFSALDLGPTLFFCLQVFGYNGVSELRLSLLSCRLSKFNITKAKTETMQSPTRHISTFHLHSTQPDCIKVASKRKNRYIADVWSPLWHQRKRIELLLRCEPKHQKALLIPADFTDRWRHRLLLTASKASIFYYLSVQMITIVSVFSFVLHATRMSTTHRAV